MAKMSAYRAHLSKHRLARMDAAWVARAQRAQQG